MGTYYVNYSKGYIDADLWEKVNKFQSYGKTPETIAEQQKAQELLAQGAKPEDTVPLMKEYIGFNSSKLLLWQLNLRTNETLLEIHEGDNDYVRTFTVFGEPNLFIWDPSFDDSALLLQEKVEELNK